jgi:hypothetical protein
VNAPRSWPKSSLSTSSRLSAAQFMAIIGLVRRGLRQWSALATSSFPVPLSPRTSTVTSASATRSIVSNTRRIAGLCPMMRSAPYAPCTCARSRRWSRRRRTVSTTRATTTRSSSLSNGFGR